MLRTIVRAVLKTLYRVEVKGLEHYRAAGDRVLIVANHLSFLDAILLAAFMPEKLMFAVNTFVARRWWVKPFLPLVDAYPLDPTNPLAIKKLIHELRDNNRKCVIFPEGRITVTGSLMKIYEGPGMVADKSDAMVLPVRLDGAQYSPFSRLRGKVRIRWFPKVTLTLCPPVRFAVAEDIRGRARRAANARALYDIMSEMLFASSEYRQTLYRSLLDARAIFGARHLVADDILRTPLSYRALIIRTLVLGRVMKRDTQPGEFVGLLLPNMVTTLVTFFALHAFGRVPAMLNFSTGAQNIRSACETARIRRVYSSRIFVEKAKLEALVKAVEDAGAQMVWLEDVGAGITTAAKLRGLVDSLFAETLHARESKAQPDDPAVVLFTSGSEGTPKGVVLSHANIQANRFQLAARIDFGPTDIVFNALPIFHSFGLTGGTLLPVLSGIRTFFYPSPLHYRIVPELVYDTNATIMFGTNTFLAGYARFANAYDFYAIRYVFAGAEKLDDETRRMWGEKFGVRIFEGYGATETAPALSTNTPMHNRAGTVGRLLPGIDHALEPVEGVDEGSRLKVCGPNVMKGYLLAEKPGVIQPPEGGWYDTGDIVSLDDEGYLRILGRAKRFAKIGGEMVSLGAVEHYLAAIWPDNHHAVVNVPDARKGEALVLVTDCKKADRKAILEHIKAQGISELSVPRTILHVDQVPLLGTGKTDYVKVRELALEKAKE